jgi:hypothetical protein
MAWVLASIPFWCLGFFFFPIGTIASISIRRPGETDEEQGVQAFVSTVLGGVFLALAAWMYH